MISPAVRAVESHEQRHYSREYAVAVDGYTGLRDHVSNLEMAPTRFAAMLRSEWRRRKV